MLVEARLWQMDIRGPLTNEVAHRSHNRRYKCIGKAENSTKIKKRSRNREIRSSRLTVIIRKNSLATDNKIGIVVGEGNGDITKIDNATASSGSPTLYLEMTK